MVGPPMKKAISNSKSSKLVGPKTLPKLGSALSFCSWPQGLWTSVPEGNVVEERPWYPTGRCIQLA